MELATCFLELGDSEAGLRRSLGSRAYLNGVVEAAQVLPKEMLEPTWEATGRGIASGGN